MAHALLLRGSRSLYSGGIRRRPVFSPLAANAVSAQQFSSSRSPASGAIAEGTISDFFELLDTDRDGEVVEADIHAFLRVLERRDNAAHKALRPIFGQAEDSTQKVLPKRTFGRDSWFELFEDRPEVLPHVKRTQEVLGVEQSRRSSRRERIVQSSDMKPGFRAGEQELFPRQRLRGYRPKGIRTFEPCPPGYVFESHLGGGAFATVFQVKNEKTGHRQAMKRIDRQLMVKNFGLTEEKISEMIESECSHLQHSDHPHIIRLFEFCQDNRFSYFIMEAADGGCLKTMADKYYGDDAAAPAAKSKISEMWVADVVSQAAYALNHLHADLRIHKDVKLENLMLLDPKSRRPHVVLIDFGFIEMLTEDGSRPFPAGTPHTMAPEVIEAHLNRVPGFDGRCDIYSLGVCAFELLVGRPPYEPVYKDASQTLVDYEATLERIYSLDIHAELSDVGRSFGAADLVTEMMSVQPENRLSAVEVYNHSWVRKNDKRATQRVKHADGERAIRSSVSSLQWSASVPQLVAEVGQRMFEDRWVEVATRMLEFSKKTEAQRKAACIMAHLHMPVRDLQRMARYFRRLDASLTGEISLAELGTMLQENLGLDDDEVKEVFVALDIHNTGSIEFREFAASICSIDAKRARKTLAWLFDALDNKLGDGQLDMHEVQEVMAEAAGGRIQMAEVSEWLQESMKNIEDLEGGVSADNLERMCLKYVESSNPAGTS